jgi:hypothetical protein
MTVYGNSAGGTPAKKQKSFASGFGATSSAAEAVLRKASDRRQQCEILFMLK